MKTARFMVPDFRGFEKIMQGRTVEQAPAMISRVCGLCSVSHQVASIKAIEKALGIVATPGLRALRDIIVLGEWISSHSLAYFFLSMPDSVSTPGGVFELARTRPDLVGEAFALRNAGQRIVGLLGKQGPAPGVAGDRAVPHPAFERRTSRRSGGPRLTSGIAPCA